MNSGQKSVQLLGPSTAGKPPSPQGQPSTQTPEQRYGPQAKTVTGPPGPNAVKDVLKSTYS
jgi:hypothetical protein